MIKLLADEHRQYRRLFDPFLAERGGSICICEWHEEYDEIERAVPALYDSIRGYPEWRAIIITKSELNAKHQFDMQNPFDFKENRVTDDDVRKSYTPIIELTHMLAGYPPLKTKGYEMGYTYFNEQSGSYEDCYYDNGQPVLQKHFDSLPETDKEEILVKYGGDLKPRLFELKHSDDLVLNHKNLVKLYAFKENRPIEVLLLTMREMPEYHDEDTISLVWEYHNEEESSDFWQRNNYPHCCRFVYCDLRNPLHTLYPRDLWTFWLLTLTLAVNQLPGASLQAYRLYKADITINKDVLGKAFEEYLENLLSVQLAIKERLILVPELTQDKKRELVPPQNIAVNYDYVEDDRIAIKSSQIGLASNCPADENEILNNYLKNSKKTIEVVLSALHEVVAAQAVEARKKIEGYIGREQVLDRFQLAGINKRIGELEPEVMNSKVFGRFNTEKSINEMAAADNEIRKYLGGRLTKRNAILISLTALFVFFCGFIPYLINAGRINMSVLGASMALTSIAVVVLALSGLLVLWFLRKRLVKKLKGYNKATREILDRINEGSQVFSDYFSNVCTYMYAQSLLSGVVLKKDKDYTLEKLQKAHLKTIDDDIKAKKFLCSLYGINLNIPFISPAYVDFEAIKELPHASHLYELLPNYEENTLELGNTGELLTAPYGFITGISLMREGIYKPEPSAEGV